MEWTKIYQANRNNKKARVEILISTKLNSGQKALDLTKPDTF